MFQRTCDTTCLVVSWPVQVANRSCLKCMDSYCDTCYTGMHRTGQMKWHRWKPLTAMCHTCKVGAGG